ncbi:MAG: PAS domain S-box protein, partial [Candidatus Altiarchaeales archaeon]|nr:PAS domain S-box protein [Candidatus Altiarchaeales archaeon]
KIILIVVVVLFLAFGINTLINVSQFQKDYEHALQTKVIVVGEYLKGELEDTMSLGLGLDRLFGVNELCQDIVEQYDEISYCYVLDANKKVLYHNDVTQINRVLREPVNRSIQAVSVQRYTFDAGERFYDISVPVSDKGSYVGTIRLGVPVQVIGSRINEMLGTSILLMIISFVVAGGIVIYAASITIVDPLRKLHEGSEVIGGGNFDHRIEIKTGDEIGELADAFNRMVLDLKKSRAEIEGYSKELEKKVEERTEELKYAMDSLENLIETSPDAIVTMDIQGRITSFNEAAERLFGYKAEEVIGTSSKGLVYDQEKLHEVIKLSYEKDVIQNYEMPFLRKDGAPISMSLSYSLLKDKEGNPIGAVGISRDITRIKKNEERLLALYELSTKIDITTKELLDFTADEVSKMLNPDMCYINTVEGDHLFFKAWRGEVKGFVEKTTSVRIDDTICGLVIEEKKAIVIPDIKKDPIAERYPYLDEHGIRSYVGVPLLTHSGKGIGTICVLNKTPRKYPKEDLELLSIFAQRVTLAIEGKEVEDALKETAEKLKEVDRLKDEFLTMTAHELKTPLTPVKVQSQLLLAGAMGKINEEQRKSLNMVLRNTDRFIRLINDISDISKIEAGTLEFYMGGVQIADVIKDSIRDLNPLTKKKQITLIGQYPAELPLINADDGRLTQVLTNLIENAVKFTQEKGKITVKAKKSRNNIVVSVEDTGIGISKKNLGKVFDKFFQADTGATRKYGGTGLGLTICRRIIEEHGGRIWVESSLGKGSKFILTLPIK